MDKMRALYRIAVGLVVGSFLGTAVVSAFIYSVLKSAKEFKSFPLD
jgi:hypothetical protein